jgi:dipeptidyl aminopeptidase/acylaminoacyl peptidase
MWHKVWRWSILLWIVGCAGAAETPPPSPAPLPTPPEDEVLANPVTWETRLISREILFGNPEKAAARISPDGRQLAFLAPDEGVLNVWVAPVSVGAGRPAPVAKLDEARAITRDRKRGIRQFFWAHTSQHVVYLQDKGGDENWRAYSVEIASGKETDLTPLEGVRAEIQEVSHRKPGSILVGLNDRNPKYHDLHEIDLKTGKRKLLQENEGYAGFVTDDDYRVRFAVEATDEGGKNYLLKQGNAFVPFVSVSMEDDLGTSIIGFDAAGRHVYMADSRGRDTAALTKLPLAKGEPEVLFESPKADVADLLLHPTKKTPQAAASVHLRKEWTYFDEAVKGDIEKLKEVDRGEIEITSRTLDDKVWTVAFLPDDGATRYYLYDRKTKNADKLFVSRTELEDAKLSKMHPVEIPTRDGLTMVAYVTLPPDLEGPRPPQPLPTVLFVHGGPWARSSWGYNPYHQWLATRGYAVLDVNFRGSTGFGKRFVNAGNGEWAAKMHDDLIDAVDWAVKEKIADRDKVAIMGGSYGGYATLVGLTFTPDKFACGVDIVGPSNLITLLSSIPPYWAPYIALFKKRVGNHTTPEGQAFLKSRSPLSFADKITRPLLIGQGANDPRVKQPESDQIVEAMQAKKIPVTYVLFPDEGHGFARPENRMSFNAVAEAFLAACLGGKAQPYGDDFAGASITVPVGAEHVPKLADALPSPKGSAEPAPSN